MPADPVEPTSRLRVVMGEEELLRARAVAAVRSAVLARHEDAEEHELAAAGLPVGELADVLAPSLFGGHRLVVVTGVQEAAAALADSLIGYAKDPDPDLTLVDRPLRRQAQRGPGQGVHGRPVPRSTSAPSSTLGRRPDRASSATRSARPGAGSPPTPSRALVEAIGADLRQLSAAAGQLVSDFGGTIDADAVARFHHGQAEVTGFTVAERVLVGDRAGLDRDAALGAASAGWPTC